MYGTHKGANVSDRQLGTKVKKKNFLWEHKN